MIELWQALLLALATAVFALVVSWITQRRQQVHELAMQQQRLDAERQSRRDEAIRASRRAQLQPVFDLLAELEEGYAHRRWKAVIDLAEKDGVFDFTDPDLMPGGVPESVSIEVMKMIREMIPAPTPPLVARASVVRLRIDDESIRRDLAALAGGLLSSDLDDTGRLHQIADLHTRLERYAAAVDSSA
jgi:hypothetical protein